MDRLLDEGQIRMFSMFQERSGSTLIKLRICDTKHDGQQDSDTGGATPDIFLGKKSGSRRARDIARSKEHHALRNTNVLESKRDPEHVSSRTRSMTENMRSECISPTVPSFSNEVPSPVVPYEHYTHNSSLIITPPGPPVLACDSQGYSEPPEKELSENNSGNESESDSDSGSNESASDTHGTSESDDDEKPCTLQAALPSFSLKFTPEQEKELRESMQSAVRAAFSEPAVKAAFSELRAEDTGQENMK